MTDKLSELLQRRRCDAGRLLTVYHEIPQSHTEGYRTERVSQSESVIHIYEWGLAMIEARKMTWPADAGNEFLQVEKKFRDIVFENHLKDGKPVSERAVKLALGYWKDGSGVGAYHYTQALALLLKTDIKVSGMNRLSRPFFCPKVCQQHPDITGMWRKEETAKRNHSRQQRQARANRGGNTPTTPVDIRHKQIVLPARGAPCFKARVR